MSTGVSLEAEICDVALFSDRIEDRGARKETGIPLRILMSWVLFPLTTGRDFSM